MKWLGNTASHNDTLTKNDIFDALDILDVILDDLFIPHRDRVKKLVETINTNKGPAAKQLIDKSILKTLIYMPICAYCGRTASGTREHVVPRFLYSFVDPAYKEAAWNDATLNRVGGQHTVKDVCSSCNSGPLSALDTYGKDFLEENGILRPILQSTLTLKYDYQRLLRWMLKIIYNSSRASQDRTHPVAELRHFILTGSTAPTSKYVFFLGELLKPHQPNIQDLPQNILSLAHAPTNPFLVRITEVRLPPSKRQRLRISSIGFGGLFFHVCFVNPELAIGYASRERRAVIRGNPRCTVIRQDEDIIDLHASHRDWRDMMHWQKVREEMIAKHGTDILV